MGKEAEFLEACREGNVIKVEHLLSTRNKKYIVPFVFSKTPSALLQSKDARGSTALHLASLNGRKAVVYLLLNEGADVTAADENGCLSLHLASWNGHLDIVSALISHDPRQETINALTRNQETALHFAAQYGHCSIVSVLLRNGAYPVTRNIKGETALDLASKYGRVEVVRCLLEANPNMVLNALVNDPKDGDAQLPPPFSPLHLAAKNGKTEVVRLLLDAGFDINFFTEEGTALHVAALFGKIDVVKLLLERGVNADARDFHGRTALELLDEHQAGKPVVLTHLLPNRDAWQHCSSMINDHLEQSSEASTVSKEVAAIYLNAIQQQQHHQQRQQQQVQSASPNTASPTSLCESVVWLPIPSNSLERRNFEQGIERPPSSTADNTKKMSKPLSVLTNFHVPPPPPSTDCESACSTISLTATPTPSPSLTITSTPSIGSMSPRFPVEDNLVITNKENPKKKPKPSRPPRLAEKGGCTYQPPPMQYDNVPRSAIFPQTAYDNVPSNSTGYDNAPPPDVHAWTHECCNNECQDTKHTVKEAAGVVNGQKIHSATVKEETALKVEVKTSPVRVSDLCAKLHEEKHNAIRSGNSAALMSVKFAEAPPETLYLPVESKLYTRMDKPFPVVAADVPSTTTSEAKQEDVVYGPYDNVPIIIDKTKADVEKSPDFPSDADKDLKIIEETIQVIEQSSKEMEENVDAMIRCPSRSSQRSSDNNNSNGSRPITPSYSPKRLSKVPPPVSPKPKFLLLKRAPLAQPEPVDLGTSTDSVEYKTAAFPAVSPSTVSGYSERKTVPKRFHHRSTSRRRSSPGLDQLTDLVPMGGSTGNIVTSSSMKRPCVDTEAQVDSGTVSSDCGGSVCSCSGGSQCSLVNSGVTSANGEGEEKEEGGTEKNGDLVSPIDEQAEWKKIEEIFKSCGTRIARLSVFDSEIQPNLTSYLKGADISITNGQDELSSQDIRHSVYMVGTVEQWLGSMGLQKFKSSFLANGFDRLDFLSVTLDEYALRRMGVDDPDDIEAIMSEAKKLPPPTARAARTYRYVSDWLQAYGCQDYLGELVKNGYDTIWKIMRLEIEELDHALGSMLLLGHRSRLAWSLEGHNDPKNENGHSLRTHSFPCDESDKSDTEHPDSATTFSAHYLGSTLIEDVSGMEATRASMTKLKKATKEISKVPQVVLEIDWRGVRVYDSASRRPLCEHAVENIHCVCQDERDMNCFAYITKDGTRHFCHVFSVLTADIATELILTLGKAFEIAYQKALRSVSF